MKKYLIIAAEAIIIALFTTLVIGLCITASQPKIPDGFTVETKGNVKVVTYIKENDQRGN